MNYILYVKRIEFLLDLDIRSTEVPLHKLDGLNKK
jgi:hypothetical protein